MAKLNVIAIRVGELPKLEEIDSSLESMQAFVDGYIEVIYPFGDETGLDGCLMVCNEEGKICGLEPSMVIDYDGSKDWMAGNVFIARDGADGEMESCTEEDLQKFKKLFKCNAFVRDWKDEEYFVPVYKVR